MSLQRQAVCLTVAAGVHVFIRGEPVSSYFSMAFVLLFLIDVINVCL